MDLRKMKTDRQMVTHIQSAENYLAKQLTSRLDYLQKVSVYASFKTKLSAANGAFISTATPLGGCEGYHIKAL